MSTENNNQLYARLFRNRWEGHAVYEVIRDSALRPGMCGYFDKQNTWNSMINIRDVTAVEKAGLSPLGAALPVVISNGTAEIWGELVSDMTRGHRHDLGLNVSAPDGTGAGCHMVHMGTKSGKAVLVTDGEVNKTRIEHTDALLDWVAANGQGILNIKGARTIRNKGFWVITKTYTVRRRAIALLQSKESEVSFGIHASTPCGVKIAPTSSWWDGEKDSGWTSSPPKPDEKDPLVIFMSGIWYKPRLFSKKLAAKEEMRKQKFLPIDHNNTVSFNAIVQKSATNPEAYMKFVGRAVGDQATQNGLIRLAKSDPFVDLDEEDDSGSDSEEEEDESNDDEDDNRG